MCDAGELDEGDKFCHAWNTHTFGEQGEAQPRSEQELQLQSA